MDIKETIERVSYYENLMREAEELLKKPAVDAAVLRAKMAALEAYYGSAEWKADFAADEAGLLPSDLKRGVLSEDGLYDLLESFREKCRRKLVFASDSFKGTLTSKKISELLTKAAAEVIGQCETVPVVLADGGEGTLDALLGVREGKKIAVTVHDPLMNEIKACYGVFGEEAVIEMAQASGLTLVPEEKRDPLQTSSIGTGELIRAALLAGYRKITVAIGGSATNDGGMGAATALGIRFTDIEGNELQGRGIDLAKVYDIDMNSLMPELKDARIRVMCDVKNPLCGENGATYVYGPQKGASEEALNTLERGMRNYRDVLIRKFGTDPDTIEGAGAAGGMGAALKILLGAELRSGIESILDIVRFDELIEGADVVITGEGRLDAQSTAGKAVQGVAERAKKAGIPCIALCGCTGEGYEKIHAHGVTRIVTLAGEDIPMGYAMEHAEEVFYQRALEVLIIASKGSSRFLSSDQSHSYQLTIP